MLAALHSAPTIVSGGDDQVSDLAAELQRWRATAAAADATVLGHGMRLADLLAKTAPAEQVQPVVVHGDFRLGNIVFDGVEPTALIDWEIWTHADPGVDLGWLLVFCDAELFPGIGAPVEGLPSAAELVEIYSAAGGRQVADLDWYQAFGRFKMAAIMAHNLRRHREGRHVDPFQEKLPPTIAALVESGIGLLDG
jgi:streptomycin 6-kinase